MAKKNKLEDIIKRDINAAIKDTAIELNKQLAQAYIQAVDAFYDDYYPQYYDRTGSLYSGSNLTKGGLISGYNEKNIKNPKKNKKGYYAEIQVSPKFIHGKPYRADTDWVFERSFISGIHGQTDFERKHWGDNKWWNDYLSQFPKYADYPEGIRLNQYKEYRNLFMHYGTTGGSFFGLNAAARNSSYQLTSQEERWISGGRTRLFNLTNWNRFRHHMHFGKKPIDLLFHSYKQIRKRKNIELIFYSKLIRRLGQ